MTIIQIRKKMRLFTYGTLTLIFLILIYKIFITTSDIGNIEHNEGYSKTSKSGAAAVVDSKNELYNDINDDNPPSQNSQQEQQQQKERISLKMGNNNEELQIKMKEQYEQQKKLIDAQQKELQRTRDQLTELEAKIRSLQNSSPRKYQRVKYLNYKERKRILITGGAGFVGSHLVDVLMFQGHEVIVVDNFFTGRKRNVEHWLGHENFELIHHDIVNPLFIEVDEIYHLASPASPPHYMFNPVKTIKTNTMGTINMLGLAKRTLAKVLIASTSEVYGDPMVHPQPETYWGHVNPIGPRACYDEGKRVSETLSYAYAKQENINVRVARIFNTFGPRMHMNDGRVVSNFILQSLRNETITVYGNGKQTRSFQYVSDLVDGLIALMESNYTLPVNLGNPVEHTIEEFAVIIKKLVGTHSEIKQIKAVEDDPQRRKPDIKRAKEQLNWEPKVSLKEGLLKTIDYFRKELERSNRFEENTKTFFMPIDGQGLQDLGQGQSRERYKVVDSA